MQRHGVELFATRASSRASKKPGDVKCKHREALYQHQHHKRAIKRPSIEEEEEEEEEVDPRVKKFNDRSRAPGLPCLCVRVCLVVHVRKVRM